LVASSGMRKQTYLYGLGMRRLMFSTPFPTLPTGAFAYKVTNLRGRGYFREIPF
jgi:hypothetical protein